MSRRTIILCYTLSAFVLTFVNSARILGIITTPSFSHQYTFRPLWKELSSRGHEITLITTDPMRDHSLKNFREIDIHYSYGFINEFNKEFNMNQNMSLVTQKRIYVNRMSNLSEIQIMHPQIKMLILNKLEQFDLVMAEYTVPNALIAFAERFKCPIIGLVSQDPMYFTYESIGNPTHPVLYPDYYLGYSENLTFWERLVSFATSAYMKLVVTKQFNKKHDEIIEKYFGKDYPPLEDIYNNVNMLFVHRNPVIHHVRPFVPAVIEIGGGSHFKSPQKLSRELESILDKATQGFIYFSMGTVVKCKDLPEHSLKVLLETFSELPYPVIWKTEEKLENKSDNVFMLEWIPQQSILKHKNIKLFITHGGLHSVEEAIHAHVPIIGLPVVRDQISNIKKIESKGLGIYMDYGKLDKTVLKNAIEDAISNPKYRDNMKKASELIRDQPMTGLEKAVWWTEYVLRHKGAKHLRSPALDIPAYQFYLLDVIGFCLAVVIIFIYLIILMIRLILKLFKFLIFNRKSKRD